MTAKRKWLSVSLLPPSLKKPHSPACEQFVTHSVKQGFKPTAGFIPSESEACLQKLVSSARLKQKLALSPNPEKLLRKHTYLAALCTRSQTKTKKYLNPGELWISLNLWGSFSSHFQNTYSHHMGQPSHKTRIGPN